MSSNNCTMHKQKVEYICLMNKSRLCPSCLVDHSGCEKDHVPLQDIKRIGRVSAEGPNQKLLLNDLSVLLKSVVRHSKNEVDKLALGVCKAREFLQNFRSEINWQIDELESTLVKESKNIKVEVVASREHVVSTGTGLIENIEKMVDFLGENNEITATENCYIFRKKKIQELQRQADSLSSKLAHVDVKMDFRPEKRDGRIHIGTVFIERKSVLIDKIADYKVIELRPHMSADIEKDDVDLFNPWYRSITFMGSSRLVAIDHWNCECLILNRELDVELVVHLKSHPMDMVADTDGTILIVSGEDQTIEKVKVTDDNKLESQKSIACFQYYDCICKVSDKKQYIVSRYGCSSPVAFAELNGNDIKTQELPLNLPKTNFYKEDAKAFYDPSQNTLIITDKLDNRIYIFPDMTTEPIVLSDKLIQQPRGICLGPHHTYLVCCAGNSSIVQFSADGFVFSVQFIDLVKPYAIAISEDKTLVAIANAVYGTRKLNLYKLM